VCASVDATRHDATPGTRNDFAAENKLGHRLCRPVIALDLYYVLGREEYEVRE